MDKYLRFDKEFGVAICIACESGVEERHFANRHKETWKSPPTRVEGVYWPDEVGTKGERVDSFLSGLWAYPTCG
jgi:hypothetical protein